MSLSFDIFMRVVFAMDVAFDRCFLVIYSLLDHVNYRFLYIITAYTCNHKDLVEMCMTHNEERWPSEFNTHGICRR